MPVNSHILITGANGFVGQHLSGALRAAGSRVSQVVRSVSPIGPAAGSQYVLDLTDRIKVAEVFSLLQPDYVIHLAGSKNRANDVAQFRDTYDLNLSMFLNVTDACRTLKHFKRLIFLGTCDEYGHAHTPYDETQREEPTNAYGLSKLAATQILSSLYRSHRFPSIALRPTVIYGPGQGDEMFLSSLIRSLLEEKEFAMTAGKQKRDFVYVNDVVDAIIKAVNADERVHGKIVNIGAGTSYQIKEVAVMTAKLIGVADHRLIKFGAVQYRPNEVMDYSVVTARAQELLGWFPSTSVEVGLQQTVEQFKELTASRIGQDQRHA